MNLGQFGVKFGRLVFLFVFAGKKKSVRVTVQPCSTVVGRECRFPSPTYIVIPVLARHVMCNITHEALLYGILVRMPVHKG